MKLAMIVCAGLLIVASAPAFAAHSWSGYLVNSDCYAARLRNVNPWDTDTYVNRDKDADLRYCAPSAKTKSFTLVDHDGLDYKLDAAGDAKAAELVRQTGKKNYLEVTVSGELNKQQIEVISISRAN